MVNIKSPAVLGLSSLLFLSASATAEENNLNLQEIFELGNQANVASLLGGDLDEAAATANRITAEDIRDSSARTMSMVLQRKQPGFYSLDHVWVTPTWGMRGINNDRNESTLLNVNGEVQNLYSKVGVQGETYLGLMGDIREVQVMSGPASVIHGPGALSGVFNIELKDGREEGAKPEELLISLGSEQDGSAEYSRIVDFDNGGKLYLSGGYLFHHERSGGYVGAQQEWAVGSPEWHHGGRITGPNSRLTAVYTNTEKMRVWARYYNAQYDNQYLQGIVGADVFDNGVSNVDNSPTEDSEGNPTVTDNDGNAIPDWDIGDNARGIVKSRRHFNENLSISADKTYDLGDGQSVKVVFGHTVSHSGMERASNTRFGRNNPPWSPGQDGRIQWDGHIMDGIGESRTRLRADYTNKNENHPLVVGAEVRFDQYGDNFLGKSAASDIEWGDRVLHDYEVIPDRDYTNVAAFGEYQMRSFAPVFVTHLGVRHDNHTKFTTTAPRVGFTSKFSEVHHLRAVYQQAFKALSADNIAGNMEAGEEPGDQDPAENTSAEIGYIFKNDSTRFEVVGYQNDIVLYAWNDELKTPEKSEYGTKGGELSLTYKGDSYAVTTSHSRHELKESLEAGIGFVAEDGENLTTFYKDITRLQFKNVLSDNFYIVNTIVQFHADNSRDGAIQAAKNLEGDIIDYRDADWMGKSITKWDIHTDYKVDDNTNFYVDLENLGKLVNEHSAGVLNTHKSLVLVDQPRVKLSIAKAF